MHQYIFKKILIADDDDVCNFISEEIIIEMSISEFGVSIANNGTEALKLITNEDFDLALLDISMPVMNGYEFLEKFTNEYPDLRKRTKIVILTSSSNSKDMENFRNLGIEGFITKPLTEAKLSDIIKML